MRKFIPTLSTISQKQCDTFSNKTNDMFDNNPLKHKIQNSKFWTEYTQYMNTDERDVVQMIIYNDIMYDDIIKYIKTTNSSMRDIMNNMLKELSTQSINNIRQIINIWDKLSICNKSADKIIRCCINDTKYDDCIK